MNMLKTFIRDEQGQDLIEYTLLLAFVALASAAIFVPMAPKLSLIWQHADSQVTAAGSMGS